MEKNKAEKRGRKPVKIDWNYVNDSLEKFCDGTEIAYGLGINKMTLYRSVKKKFKVDFVDYKQQKRARACLSLRKAQFELAKTNAAMAIFLGKNYLGQSDKQEIQHSGGVKIIKDNI